MKLENQGNVLLEYFNKTWLIIYDNLMFESLS